MANVSSLGGFEQASIWRCPKKCLVTVMRDHQSYFAVEDKGRQALAPYFLAVLNTETDAAGAGGNSSWQ